MAAACIVWHAHDFTVIYIFTSRTLVFFSLQNKGMPDHQPDLKDFIKMRLNSVFVLNVEFVNLPRTRGSENDVSIDYFVLFTISNKNNIFNQLYL